MIAGIVGLLLMPGCARLKQETSDAIEPAEPYVWNGDVPRPQARPDGASANAPAATPTGTGSLGTTIVSLGSPTQPGLWLKTPLVAAPTAGRVRYGGGSVDLQLLPIDADSNAGSRMSLKAMQSLGIPLTDLAEVEVSLP